jgi:ribosomal peptide maturation radical SAM protein 1
MPFGSSMRPSFGLSLLKAELEREGLACDVHYLNLHYAELLGSQRYNRIGDSTAEALMGEWVFAADLFGDRAASANEFFTRVLPPGVNVHEAIADFLMARDLASLYLEQCERLVAWQDYALVGFTSMFQQNVASLALARRLKRIYPQLKIAFGGANCEGDMGMALHRLFPFIDYVCSGEGDIALPVLARRVVEGRAVGDIAGIIRREDARTVAPSIPGAPVFDLDSLPEPDFDDFLKQRATLSMQDQPGLCALIETSRGCWWGQKSHCTFCGLNGSTLQFRVKSPERAVAEFASLAERYQPEIIEAVDNILDMRYFRDVLPRLVEMDLGVRVFYETKANLRRDQVRLAREAGIEQIQPGIESLNSHVLKLMRKGVTAMQNIQLLRWCAEYMLEPGWNLIAGFPGEHASDYARQAEIVPLLTHLNPPLGVAPLRLDRFSPLFMAPTESGLERVRPAPAYGLIYPFAERDLAELAYYFTFDYVDGRDPTAYLGDLRREVEAWRTCAPHSDLISLDLGEHLLIWDTRPVAIRKEHRLWGLERAVYTACDSARTLAEIEAMLAQDGVADPLQPVLNALIDAHLVLREDGRYFGLAVPGEYQVRWLRRRLERAEPLPASVPPLLAHVAGRLSDAARR